MFATVIFLGLGSTHVSSSLKANTFTRNTKNLEQIDVHTTNGAKSQSQMVAFSSISLELDSKTIHLF